MGKVTTLLFNWPWLTAALGLAPYYFFGGWRYLLGFLIISLMAFLTYGFVFDGKVDGTLSERSTKIYAGTIWTLNAVVLVVIWAVRTHY